MRQGIAKRETTKRSFMQSFLFYMYRFSFQPSERHNRGPSIDEQKVQPGCCQCGSCFHSYFRAPGTKFDREGAEHSCLSQWLAAKSEVVEPKRCRSAATLGQLLQISNGLAQAPRSWQHIHDANRKKKKEKKKKNKKSTIHTIRTGWLKLKR